MAEHPTHSTTPIPSVKNRHPPIALLLICLAGSACTSQQTSAAPPRPDLRCDTTKVHRRTGDIVTVDPDGKLVVGGIVVRHAGRFRVIRPGDAVTEDYSDQRLNIEVDDNMRLRIVWCG